MLAMTPRKQMREMATRLSKALKTYVSDPDLVKILNQMYLSRLYKALKT